MGKAVWAFVFLAVVSMASAQEANRLDLAISGAGVFSKTATASNGSVSDKPTNSVAVLGSVRYHLTRKHAFEGTIGRTSNSQIFSVPSNTYRVPTTITEYSIAYVFSPFSSAKWQPFALGGAGGLHFSPGSVTIDTFPTSVGTTTQTSLAFLYGLGTDYHLWRLFSLRLQYRGLIFKEPDFKVPALFFTGARTHIAEPSLGIVVKF